MAEITVNGLRATLCALTLPRFGAWVADVDVDSAEAITGAVTLAIDDDAQRDGLNAPGRA
mgnify:CR=1 FL=1